MAANSFKKGSGKDEMAKRILESALSTLIAIDTNHNYVLEGSTATNPTLTEAGTKLVASMQSSVRDTAGTIGDAIAGMKKSQVKKSDSIIIYDEGSQSNYRVTFETLAALIVAGAIDGGDVLTTAKLWSHMASNTEYQINISHLRDALADYLTKDKLQGLFRTEGGDAFLSKIFDDEALGVITFLSGLRSNGVAYMMKGLQIGLYQPGITGFGAKIDENGNGEFESLVVRRFLDVPELRYNRVEVLAGDKWRAPGGGIIESVTPDVDPETGNILATGTISLKLEEGEVGCIAVDDICMGIFHDFNDPSNNDDATTDDGFGNRTFAGFCTSYFRITEVTATTNIDCVNYYNKVFKYALRPIGGRWSRQIHPQNFMNFVVYGNFTNTSRQSSTYETTAYTRMLRAQNTWEFSWNNIGMQFGDCSLLANFDTQEEPNERANEASKYLFYIDGDIFHTGVLRRVDSHGRDIIDYYDQGVWDPNTEYFYKDRVYWNGSMWLLVREDTVDDQGVHHGITGSEPSEDNPNWLAVVYSQSVRSMGHWEATKCPYPVSAIVNLAGILYISNKETSNPPRGLLTGLVNGQTTYLKDKDGKYFLIDEDESNISDDWDVLLDIREMVSGEDAIYINLTNDADSIITDINGNIAPGTEYPTTKAQLYRGSVQITSGITWGVSAVGCSASIAPESGTVVTSNMTADKATVTISATYNNITYHKVFTFSKLFGADKYYLQPSADVIKFNPNANGGTGEYTPTSLTVRAYVIKGGDKLEITSGAGLGYIRFGGNTYYSGMTVKINNMSVFTSGKLTFELFDNQSTPQLQDMEEVPLVQDGVNGAGSAVVNLTNDTDTVCCDSEGNIDPSDSLPTTNAQLYHDLQKVTTGLTWNCNATGCTATIEEDHDNPGEGKLTVTAMSADVASVLIFCNFRGEQYSKIFTFKKLFGADKYYLQMSGDAVVMDKTGSFRPNSITARAFCKRFGNDPIECTAKDFPHIKIACQALQQQSGYSPQSVVMTDSVFTDRHLVFTLIDDSTPGDVKVLDTEDIPLVMDGTDGIDGQDGKDWHYAGMWDSEAEYKAGDVVRMGDTMYVALVDNTNKPPREILKDGVDGKYLKDENDRYLMTGSDLTDDINWDFYFRDGRDGIDGVDGIDGRDGQDGDTPVFVNLTNDTDSVICDMDGNPLEELPTTIAQFFFGSIQLLHEDGVEWSISHLVGCTLEGETGITDDGYVQVKTMSADRAQVTIRATYKTQYYEKNFNFTKLYGTDKYVLAPNFGTVQFNPNNGTYYPTALVLNAFVVKNGTTIDLTQASGLGYIQIGNDTQHKYYNGDSIQTATFFATSGIEITLRDPDGVVKDKEYIPRISDGRRGDDGDDAVTMWFDDSNIHFICDAAGTPVSGQTYSTTGKLYKGGNDVALHASLSKAESTTVNCTGVLNVADNTEFILTVTGFKAGAIDSNEVKVTLVAADESVSREFIVHVDKVRPGADGKSPVIYNVVPNTNVVNKNKETGVFTPDTLTPGVRKSYVDSNGAVAHQMLSASQALSSEGIHIYYRFDAMIQTVTEAIGNLDNGNPLTLPSSMNSYVNFAIAKSDCIILDNQSVSAISDGIDGEDGKSYVSRGHWNSGEEYNVGDMVSFAGSIYRCLVASSNVPPLQCLTDNGNFFLVDENGNYIINYPIVSNTANWELSIEYQRRIMFDLDNESDTILYDTNGKKVSQDVISHAILYVDGAEYVGAATYGINASGCTATISGRTIIVTGVSGTGGTVEVTCTYDGNTYTAILSVRKMVGVNKYEIVPSANSVKKDPNNNNQYTPSAGVTFQIFRTDQTGTRRALTASDMNTGDEEGFRIGLIRGGQSEATISINYTITPSDFEIGDCRITLYDKNNSVQDSEYIPVIAEGMNGKNAIRVDLDNENDSMLYDGSGNLISGNCVANATLYDGEVPVTSALTWKITVRSGSVTTNAVSGTLPGNQLVVSGISSDAATILVYTRYKEYERGITLTLKRLVGVDKYELSVSPNSVGKNGNTGAYDTDYIAVDVYKTAQNGSRTKLNSLPTGYTLKSIINGVTESISLGSQSIAKAKFAGTNIAIELMDNNNSLLDNENVPIVSSGATGSDAVIGTALPASLIINQDITNTSNIDSPNLSETIIMELWEGNTKLGSNMISSLTVHQNNPHVYINNSNNTPVLSADVYVPSDRFVIKGVAKDGNGNYYSDANISVTVRFYVNGSSVQKVMTVPVRVYVNLLGTWKVTVENGAEQKVGERIAYEAGPNGTVLRTAWNANISESATALRSEYTEQIGKASEYGANLFGFSKGVTFSGNIIPFIQGYGFAQSGSGQLSVSNLGFDGKGGYFAISFYARMSSTSRDTTFYLWANGEDDQPIVFNRTISASSWTRVTQVVYIKSYIDDASRKGCFYVNDMPSDNIIYVRQLKIERGKNVTEFSPANEDLALVGNGQLITSLDNAGMSVDRPEINGRMADYYAYVNPSSLPTDFIDYLFKNNAFNITAGKMYTLSFWAKCSSYGMIITTNLYKPGESIISSSDVIYDPGTNGSQIEKLRSDGESKVRLSTAWKQYFIHLYATNNVTGASLIALRVVKAENANVTGTIYMSDIRFVEGFETIEGQYKSLFEQTARRISMSVEHDLLQTGIDITHQRIILRADQVVFASSNGVSGKIWIDATDGTLHAINGHFSGIIEANGGTFRGLIKTPFREPTNVFDNLEGGGCIKIATKAQANAGISLPVLDSLDGTEIDIVNLTKYNTYITAAGGTGYIMLGWRRVSSIKLGYKGMICKLKAVKIDEDDETTVPSGTVIWSIINASSFKYTKKYGYNIAESSDFLNYGGAIDGMVTLNGGVYLPGILYTGNVTIGGSSHGRTILWRGPGTLHDTWNYFYTGGSGYMKSFSSDSNKIYMFVFDDTLTLGDRQGAWILVD